MQSLLQPIPGHSKESRRVASGGRRGGGSLFLMIGSAGLCGGLMLPSMLSAPQTLFCSTCMHKLSSAMSLLVNSLKLQADVQV